MNLKNQKWERFAQLVASGNSAVEAYRLTYGCSKACAEANAHRLKENDGVSQRISDLQRKAENESVMTLLERRQRLARIVRLNPATFDPIRDGDLIEEVTVDAKGTVHYRFPSKLAAIIADSRLAGELIGRRDLQDEHGNLRPSVVPAMVINVPDHWNEPRVKRSPTLALQ